MGGGRGNVARAAFRAFADSAMSSCLSFVRGSCFSFGKSSDILGRARETSGVIGTKRRGLAP